MQSEKSFINISQMPDSSRKADLQLFLNQNIESKKLFTSIESSFYISEDMKSFSDKYFEGAFEVRAKLVIKNNKPIPSYNFDSDFLNNLNSQNKISNNKNSDRCFILDNKKFVSRAYILDQKKEDIFEYGKTILFLFPTIKDISQYNREEDSSTFIHEVNTPLHGKFANMISHLTRGKPELANELSGIKVRYVKSQSHIFIDYECLENIGKTLSKYKKLKKKNFQEFVTINNNDDKNIVNSR